MNIELVVAVNGIFCFPNGIVSLLLEDARKEDDNRKEVNTAALFIDGARVELPSLIRWFLSAKTVWAKIEVGTSEYDSIIHKADFTAEHP